MKKVYFVGDIITNTGPAIVNKSYHKYLKDKIVFCTTNNKIFRTIHFLLYVLFINTVIISGYSDLNRLLAKVSKILNKKTFYLMHGFMKEEMKYQETDCKEKNIKGEYLLLNCIDKIICVSEMFSAYLISIYPEFKEKVSYLNNGVDINTDNKKIPHDVYTIISVGGGMKIKNNITICEAIQQLELDIRFIVIGRLSENGAKIKEYQFVEYYEELSHEEVLNKMCEADLYIQNSYFETFGLAVMEALECGCDLLISKNVGALSILENISEKDIINNVDNLDEITKKIKGKMMGNICKINYNKNTCSYDNRKEELIKIVENYK